MDSRTWRRRARRWLRHAEFGVIVPVGIAATMVSLTVGAFGDVLRLVGSGLREDFLTRIWYGTLLPSVGALFCAFFSVKARFVLIRLFALLTAIGMASRVAMSWCLLTENIRLISAIRLAVTAAFVFVCWFYGRGLHLDSETTEASTRVGH